MRAGHLLLTTYYLLLTAYRTPDHLLCMLTTYYLLLSAFCSLLTTLPGSQDICIASRFTESSLRLLFPWSAG